MSFLCIHAATTSYSSNKYGTLICFSMKLNHHNALIPQRSLQDRVLVCRNGAFTVHTLAGIILCMHPANERWRYIVTSSLIGWARRQNNPCCGSEYQDVGCNYQMILLTHCGLVIPYGINIISCNGLLPGSTKLILDTMLTLWGQDKTDATSQKTFSSAFSWMKMFEFWLKFHWSLFLRAQLTIFQHWFR